MTCGIYCITHRDSGRRYVGLSVNIRRRWSDHKRASLTSKDGYVVHRAIAKYGVSAFDFEILEVCDKSQLGDREVYWVAAFDSYKNGFNLTPGGYSPEMSTEIRGKLSARKKTDAEKKLFSDAAKARWADPVRRAELMATRANREPPSEETRKKLSESLIKHLQSDEAKHQRSQQMKDRYSTPESRAEQSEKLKAALASPEARARRSEQMKATSSTPEFKAFHSASMKARYASPDERLAQSERLKAYWAQKRQEKEAYA